MKFIEKIEILKRAMDEFKSSITVDFRNTLSSLSIDDVISTEFESHFLKLFWRLNEEKFASDEERFVGAMQMNHRYSESYGSNIVHRFESKPDELRRLSDKYIDYCKKTKKMDLNLSPFKGTSEENYIAKRMIEEDDLSDAISDPNSISVLYKTWDKVMSTADEETINKLLAYIESKGVEYTNMPLVILNSNISQESKIAIIKKTYKQKDLHKYTMFMRDQIVDLDDLDTFIEATITQNPRVKEKDNNLFDIMKRIFVGIRGFTSSISWDKLQNKDKFFNKYRGRITVDFCNKLLEDNSYYSRRNAKSFILNAFDGSDFEQKIELAAKLQNMRGEFFSRDSIKRMLAESRNDAKREKLLLNYIVNNDSSVRDFYDDIGTSEMSRMINAHPEIFSGKIGSLLRLGSTSSWYGKLSNEDTKIILGEMTPDVYNRDDFNIFDRSNRYNSNSDLNDNSIKTFGITAGSNNNNNYRDSASESIFKFIRFIADLSTGLNLSDNKGLKELIFNKYFSSYIDEDFIASDMLSVLSLELNRDSVSKIVSNMNNVSEADFFQEVLFRPIIKLFAENFSGKLEELRKVLEPLEMNLKILMNI